MLDDILKYHERPEDSEFVVQVMQRVRRQKRQRHLILAATGVIGAAFGAFGVLTLTEPVMAALGSERLLPASVGLVVVLIALAWLFRDEVTVSG